MSRFLGCLCLSIVLVGTGGAQQKALTFLRLGANIVQNKVSLNPATPADRFQALHALFTAAGCQPSQIVEQPVSGSIPDLTCTTRGTSDSVIVILAPSDYTSKGDEAGLQWGDVAMLPILAESLGSVLTRHKFVFLALSGSRDQAGGKAFLDHLSAEQRQKIHAVVALDHIGRPTLQYSVAGTESGVDVRTGRYGGISVTHLWDPSQLPLTQSIPAAALRWHLPIPLKDDAFGSKDTKPFRQQNIPAVTFSSPAWVIARYIGDQAIRDYRTKLDSQAYDNTYLFLCAYLLLLDRDVGKGLPVPGPQTRFETADASVAPNLGTSTPVPSTPVTEKVATEAPPSSPASETKAPAEMPPTFRVTTRLVQVDVTVTDKQGHPVQGLGKEDFSLSQDGKAENVRIFEEHTSVESAPSAQPAAPESKPHSVVATYSNKPDSTSAQSRTVLLFDMLNTPAADQQLARNQLKKFAEALQPGQPVALFVLTSRMLMVNGFSDDPKGLLQAVNQLQSQLSQLLTTEAERQRDVGDIVYGVMESSAGGGSNPSGSSGMSEDKLARLLSDYQSVEGMRADDERRSRSLRCQDWRDPSLGIRDAKISFGFPAVFRFDWRQTRP